MRERRLTNSQLRLRRLEERDAADGPRGILEIFAEPADEPPAEDAALTREDEESRQQ